MLKYYELVSNISSVLIFLWLFLSTFEFAPNYYVFKAPSRIFCNKSNTKKWRLLFLGIIIIALWKLIDIKE